MLATLVDEPFHRDGWVYEEKYDGYRILAYKEGPRVTLYSRNAKDRTESFSQIALAIATLPDRTLLLDGEAVAFDGKLVSALRSVGYDGVLSIEHEDPLMDAEEAIGRVKTIVAQWR